MEVISPAWRSDLALLARTGSEVTHRPGHVVVRTPSSPASTWGNFILLGRSPQRRDVDRLLTLFETLLPGVPHQAFGIDDPEGTAVDLSVLETVGFRVTAPRVLAAAEVRPPARVSTSAQLRPLDRPSDWAQRISLDLAVRGDDHPGAEELARSRAAVESELVAAGQADVYGAFDDGRLVAAVGVADTGDAVARFQDVQTHPEARRRGLASTLAYLAGQHALERLGGQTLVAVAEPGHAALRVFRGIGMVAVGAQLQAVRPA